MKLCRGLNFRRKVIIFEIQVPEFIDKLFIHRNRISLVFFGVAQIRLNMFFLEQEINQLTDEISQYCDNRNTEKHSEGSGQSAAHGNRKNNGNRLKAGGFPENFWTDDGAVKLLDRQNEDGKNQCGFRADDQ